MKGKQKEEAIKRMKKLGIVESAIQQFKEEDIVLRTEKLVGMVGAFYPLTLEEKNIIVEFEEEFDALVYMMIQTPTIHGVHKALLYVSAEEDEWQYDMADIRIEQAIAYIVNCSDPDCSEFGFIGIKSIGGCLTRTW